MIEYHKWPNSITLPVLYANRQWAVTRYGLECLTQDYPIERGWLTEKHNGDVRLSSWIIHLSEKDWVDVHELADAFGNALEIHRVRGRTLIDINESVTAALKNQEDARKFARFCDEIGAHQNVANGVRIISAADLLAADELYQENKSRVKSVRP